VVGVDVDSEAVAFAQQRYSRGNVSFFKIEGGGELPFSDASFDVVLSFQVIEHVWDDIGYLREARRVLKPGGVVVLVTPDRRHRLLPGQRPWNRWHVREYSGPQLARRVSQYFDIASSLRMGGAWNIAGVEIRRYRKTKWLTLPFTLPILPDLWRRGGLDLLHALRAKPRKVDAERKIPLAEFGFDHTAMLIEEDPPNSLNLVIVARKDTGAAT
jgi:SAM-dependent methyltransferase